MRRELQIARFWLNSCRVSQSFGSCAAIRSETLVTGMGEVPDMSACVKYCMFHCCYTLHCLCETIPAHASNIESQLAFVIRSVEDQWKTQVKKKTSSSNRGLCLHGTVFCDVGLKGGKKAGNLQIFRGAKDTRTGIRKCC